MQGDNQIVFCLFFLIIITNKKGQEERDWKQEDWPTEREERTKDEFGVEKKTKT